MSMFDLFRKRQPDPLDTAMRYGVYSSALIDGCVMVYRYPNVAVSHVNRDLLRTMVMEKDYKVSVSVSDSGEVFAVKNNKVVAKIVERTNMLIDWKRRGDPVVCEFAYFARDKEKVALFFYQNEQNKMAGYPFEIVMLSSCLSNERQENIACLEPGEKLFLDLDDNDAPYVHDIEINPLGKLPAKMNRLYASGQIVGIYFDHTETKYAEEIGKDDKEIPFVKVFYSK